MNLSDNSQQQAVPSSVASVTTAVAELQASVPVTTAVAESQDIPLKIFKSLRPR